MWWKWKCSSLSHVQLFFTPWTVARQAPLSLGFSRQEYWSGLPFPSPDLPDPGIKLRFPALQIDSLPSETPGKPWWDEVGDKEGSRGCSAGCSGLPGSTTNQASPLHVSYGLVVHFQWNRPHTALRLPQFSKGQASRMDLACSGLIMTQFDESLLLFILPRWSSRANPALGQTLEATRSYSRS